MNLDDLTDVLRERAERAESTHTSRMVGVRARVRAAHRRRLVGAVACLLLVLAGVAYATTPVTRESQPALPRFPDHALGTRVVAQSTGTGPTATALAFTPDTTDLSVLIRCDTDQRLLVLITADWKAVYQMGCGRDAEAQGGTALRNSLAIGEQVVLRMTVLGRLPDPVGAGGELDRAPDGVALQLAVGRAVPMTEYPMPPRPEDPPTLEGQVYDADLVLRSDPADPNRPQQVTTRWRGIGRIELVIASPGRLRVYVGSQVVDDYAQYSYSLIGSINTAVTVTDAVPDAEVVISVVPEGVLGEWAVMVDEGVPQ